jgi:hypothetical protein
VVDGAADREGKARIIPDGDAGAARNLPICDVAGGEMKERFKLRLGILHLRILYILAFGQSVCFNCTFENCEEPMPGADGRLRIVGYGK